MKRFLIMVALVAPFLSMNASGQEVGDCDALIIPYFAVGGGTEYRDEFRLVDGYESGLMLVNTTSEEIEVWMEFFDGGGGGFGDSGGERAVVNIVPAENVPPGLPSPDTTDGRLGWELQPYTAFQEVLSLLNQDIQTGWIEVGVTADCSEELLLPKVFLQYRYKVNGMVVGQAAVEAVKPAQRLAFYGYVSSPERDPSATAIALTNPSENPATITFTQYGVDGSKGSSAIYAGISPRSQFVQFLDEIIPPLPPPGYTLLPGYEGLVTIESDVPIVVVALQTTGDLGNFNFSTLPVIEIP